VFFLVYLNRYLPSIPIQVSNSQPSSRLTVPFFSFFFLFYILEIFEQDRQAEFIKIGKRRTGFTYSQSNVSPRNTKGSQKHQVS